MKFFAVAFVLVLVASSARAQDAEGKFPHFASFKAAEVFMREGPSKEHRVKWVYHRKGLPVEVLAVFDVWCRVRASDGEMGWVHRTMLSSERTAIVTGQGDMQLRSAPNGGGDIATVQLGAIGRLETCNANMCEMKFGDTEGWLDRARLWGVYANEKFD